jgi:glycerol-3-phosphate dehydrogenase (NAD(P)+)
METAAIFGAGAWGTALAIILARDGHRVILGVRRDESLKLVSGMRENSTYLPGVQIPPNVDLAASWPGAVASASVTVMAVPSRYEIELYEPRRVRLEHQNHLLGMEP